MSTTNYVPEYFRTERRRADKAARRGSTWRLWVGVSSGMLLLAGLDYLLVLDQRIRLTALGCWGVLSLGQLAIWARAFSQRVTAKQIAARVEQASGQETVVLTTAADEHVRRTLAGQKMLTRLDDHARRLTAGTRVDFGRRSRHWLLGGLALAGACGWFTAIGGWQSFQRMMLPWIESPYTQLELTGPQGQMPVFSTFQLNGAMRGRQADDLQLHCSFDDQTIPVEPGSDGSFQIELPGVSEDCTYWVTAGDGRSRQIEIQTFTPVEVVQYEVNVTPPQYAARLATVHDGPNFEVLRQSSCDYRIRVNHPVASMELAASPNGQGETPEPIRFYPSGGDELLYEAKLQELTDDLTYRIVIRDHQGNRSQNDEPFRVLVLPDEPPTLRITGHDAKQTLKLGNEGVTVQVKAVDDVALSELKLVYRQIGKPGVSATVPIDPQKPFEFTARSILELAPLELEPMDVVAVHAEGADGNLLDGPGTAKSSIVMFQVPEPPQEQQASNADGGGGGGQQVNPLEMQKFLLQDTSALVGNEDSEVFREIQLEQEEVNGFAEALLSNIQAMAAENPRARGLAAQLELALSTMRLSGRQLARDRRDETVLAQEFAVATLTEAAKMMGGPT